MDFRHKRLAFLRAFHLIITLASTTRLGTVFSFLSPFDDEVSEVHMPPCKALTKRLHLISQGAALG